MSTKKSSAVSLETVHAAAALVALPLTADEENTAAELLSRWIPAAMELANRMQSPELNSIMPITVYGIPADIINEFS